MLVQHTVKHLAPPILIALAIATGCVTTGPNGEPFNPEPEEKTPLQVAEGHLSAREYRKARVALEEHLDDNPEDYQARYLLAKTLGYLGELRGAKAELMRTVAEDPENPLAWDLLGAVHEQLGEHGQALGAYFEVQKRSESLSPILGIARCQLYLGQPEAALGTLETLRTRNARSPWTEFFTYQALRRMGRPDDAETAARAYLDLAQGLAEHETHMPTVRRWLDSHRFSLSSPARQVMVDFVRAACRLRLPQAEPPEDAVLRGAPERLFVFDDRPVFITLYTPERRFVGRGRGKSLAAALKGALDGIHSDPTYAPLKVREAALRIDVGRDLEPAELRSDGGSLTSKPALERGRHGIALRADGQEVVALPGDVISEDLPDLESLLALACVRAGLGADAWRTSTSAVYRFETEAFFSPAPGVSPQELIGSEPAPLPEPTLRAVRSAQDRAGRWLLTQIQPQGALAMGYSPARDGFDTSADEQVLLASRAVSLRAALALSRLRKAGKDQAFLGACQHLVGALAKGDLRPGEAPALRQIAEGAPEAFPELLARLGADPKLPREPALGWAKAQLSRPPPADPLERAGWLGKLAEGALEANRAGSAEAGQLRKLVLRELGSLLALQLGPRHRFLCKEPGLALGAFRRDLGALHLDAAMTVEALAALAPIAELLSAE